MASKIGQLKLFYIEEKKEGPKNSVSETTANKWQGCMLANIRKEESWNAIISDTWQPKKVANRGKTAAESTKIDAILFWIRREQLVPGILKCLSTINFPNFDNSKIQHNKEGK